MNYNRVVLVGRVGFDPELKTLDNGTKITNLSLVTNRMWIDKEGAKQEQADFHSVKCFAKTAEQVAQYLKKGQTVLAEGRLQTRITEYNGKKNYQIDVIAERVVFGAPARKNEAMDGDEKAIKPIKKVEYPTEEININDIPF